MKSNVEIIQDTIEHVVNQKDINAWDLYFSQDYKAQGAPNVGMGFSRDTSKNKHIIDFIFPGSPAEGKLQVGDELIWVKDDEKRWTTFEEIEKGLRGKEYILGVQRDDKIYEYEMARDLFEGFVTHNNQAKSEMNEFMKKQFPDLKATIKLIFADGEMVVSLLEYRGTHAEFKREAVWREAWIARINEGKIVEGWPIIDLDSYFRHLGFKLTPPSE